MNNAHHKSTRTANTLRWLARILGLISVVVFLVFFGADCVKKGTIAVESDRIAMTVFLLAVFIGLITAWKWEGIGGTIAVLALIGFVISAPETLARPAVLFMSVLYGLPALLFLLSRWIRKRKGVSSAA